MPVHDVNGEIVLGRIMQSDPAILKIPSGDALAFPQVCMTLIEPGLANRLANGFAMVTSQTLISALQQLGVINPETAVKQAANMNAHLNNKLFRIVQSLRFKPALLSGQVIAPAMETADDGTYVEYAALEKIFNEPYDPEKEYDIFEGVDRGKMVFSVQPVQDASEKPISAG